VTSLTLGRLRATGETFLRELADARYREVTGASGPGREAVAERYAYDLGPEALEMVLDFESSAAAGSADARCGRSLLRWIASLSTERSVAPISREIADWRARTIVRTSDSRAVAFEDVDREIARETDHAARVQLDKARVATAALDLAPLLAERSSRERDTLEALEIEDSPLELARRLTGSDPAEASARAEEALRQSADAWRETLGDGLRKRFGLSLHEAAPADLIALLDLGRYDAVFRASGRDTELRKVVQSLGLNPDLGGHLAIERGARDAGRGGSEVIGLEVPGDVHLMLGVVGGVDTMREALGNLGRALRLAQVEGDAPFELRWLGDPAHERACGRLLESLLLDEGWLMRVGDLSRGEARTFARLAAARAVFELRRSSAMCQYHVQVAENELSRGAVEELYIELIGKAIGVSPNGFGALVDAPHPATISNDFRSLESASTLGDELVHRFDVDWYRNPRAGPWLTQNVLGPADGELAGDVVVRSSGRAASIAPYIRRLERVLAA
jgi:hypothetical protein